MWSQIERNRYRFTNISNQAEEPGDPSICSSSFEGVTTFASPGSFCTSSLTKPVFLPTLRVRAEQTLEKEGYLAVYQAAFQSFLEGDYAVEICRCRKDEGYYIPHFPVYRANSETPVRPVFNASLALKDYKSLNDCFFKGIWPQFSWLRSMDEGWRLFISYFLRTSKKHSWE